MPDLTRDQRIALYRYMRTTRLVEEKLVALYRQGKIVGGLYRCLGQEATAVGSAFALSKGDVIGPLIRNLGSVLVMGFSPRDVFAQHMGKATAPSKGKDGNLHLGRPEEGVVSAISMLGALIPVMAGIALGARMRRQPLVAMTYIGDGGTSTGPFHEGMNLGRRPEAAARRRRREQRLGLLDAVSKADRRAQPRGPRHGLRGPRRVRGRQRRPRGPRGVPPGRAHARAGEGPSLVEAVTYRMKGHAEHDNQEYVPKQELEAWIRRDPIEAYARGLQETGAAAREELAAIDREISAGVERDADLADRDPFPAGERALEGVYATALRTPAEVAAVRDAP
jgi:pyruvate dehydrogenase E1 component alpha subunit/2-oxoisovalerate dehydrogenase E1 component alpha subunit